jgi:hypothetical protein
MSTERKFKTALDEMRLLILGAQILFGFEFEAVFQEGFRELPPRSHMFDAIALPLIPHSIAASARRRLSAPSRTLPVRRFAICLFARHVQPLIPRQRR